MDKLTKCCSWQDKGENGFTDNLTTLQKGDDVANINWEGGWHIPTREQWKELIQNTNNKWSTQNGVNGWLFTASNGKSLFLPAGDVCAYEQTNGIGDWGTFYPNSLLIGDPTGAWYLDFSKDKGCKVYYNLRQ